jgi:hypothetical protein
MSFYSIAPSRDNPLAKRRNPLARECLARLWTCALFGAVDGSFGSILLKKAAAT